MGPNRVFFTMFCACYCVVLGIAKKSYRIGVFFNEKQSDFPINWEVINDTIAQDIAIYYPDITTIKKGESLNVMDSLCRSLSQEEPLLAIFSDVEDSCISSTLDSMCSHLKIPFITTNQRNKIRAETMFNMYPDAVLLSQGFAKIVESFDWDSFIILYENEDSLLRLQDVIKLQQFSKNIKEGENVIILKLDENGDNRYLLKSLKNLTIRRIILDCHVDNITNILKQANETNILTDFSTSIFLTSLDAHTLDFTAIKNILANITTVRLFNPNDKNFKATVKNYFPEHFPDKIRVKTTIFHDALSLFTLSVNMLTREDLELIERTSLNCDSQEKSTENNALILVDKIKQIKFDSLTGQISMKKGVRDKFTLEVLEVDSPEKPIGIWYSDIPEKVYLTRNATEREAELQKRLSSHNFIVTSRIEEPYLFENKDPNAVGNARYYGYSMDLIYEIAKLMNITFEFRITEGNHYANLANDLIERRADLGICDFTITPQRREIIDFSMPFMTLGIGILHKKSTQVEEVNLYGFMDPFSWSVWLYMWSLNLIISLVMFVVARMAPNEWEPAKPWDQNPEELENIWDIPNFIWLTLGSITTQGCDILPKAFSTRVISASWWFFSLIMSSSYTANLAAFLTAQKKEVVIDNVEELAAQSTVKYGYAGITHSPRHAETSVPRRFCIGEPTYDVDLGTLASVCLGETWRVCNPGIRVFGLVEGASTAKFFEHSNNSLYQKMWNNMVNEKPSVFEVNNKKGVARVLATKDSLYAYFMESTGIEYVTERECDLRKIGDLLDSKSYGIGMPMNADYRHQINKAVLELQESGKLGQLKEKWWKNMREGKPCPAEQADSEALGLSNVGGIFIVLGVGIALAYLLAILEFLWHVRKVSVEEKVSYSEALKIELKFACNIFRKKKRANPIASEKSSTKSLSLAKNEEKLPERKSASHLSVPVLLTNGGDDKSLRKRSRGFKSVQE